MRCWALASSAMGVGPWAGGFIVPGAPLLPLPLGPWEGLCWDRVGKPSGHEGGQLEVMGLRLPVRRAVPETPGGDCSLRGRSTGRWVHHQDTGGRQRFSRSGAWPLPAPPRPPSPPLPGRGPHLFFRRQTCCLQGSVRPEHHRGEAPGSGEQPRCSAERHLSQQAFLCTGEAEHLAF